MSKRWTVDEVETIAQEYRTVPTRQLATRLGRSEIAIRRQAEKQGIRKDQSLWWRFWAKVRKSEKCWEWTGARTPRGYGKVQWLGRLAYAHRVAWAISFGVIPDNLCVMHLCDNPVCVRPDHLALGTHQENMDDMRRKGRGSAAPKILGQDHPSAKLTEDKVRMIRHLIAEGYSVRMLAERYGVTKETIRAVITRQTWRHVED